MTDPTTADASTSTTAPESAPASVSEDPTATPAPTLYTVNRAQDGAEVRRGLDLDTATSECAILNAQARMPAGQTLDGVAIYGSMFHGSITEYEVRSMSGLAVAS